jgi:hypothetical protein
VGTKEKISAVKNVPVKTAHLRNSTISHCNGLPERDENNGTGARMRELRRVMDPIIQCS